MVRLTAPEVIAEKLCRKLTKFCPIGVDLLTNADGKSLEEEQADQGKEKAAKAAGRAPDKEL